MSETKTKNLCTVPAADLTDSQYFIAEDGGELKRIPKAQVVLKKLEKMLATDTENLAGGGEVTAQELLDALAEQVANKLLAKSQVVNNLLATVEGNPLDATQGKALKELIDTTNNNLSKCVKINPEGVKSATISNGYPEGRYFDISVEQLNGESIALFSVTKDTVDVVTYENNIWTNRYSLATKSDSLRFSRTYIDGNSYADAKNLSIPPGIYNVNPDFKNIPETTYGFLEIVADSTNNWRLIKFIPTNIKSYYLMFYNGYDKTWESMRKSL